MLQSVSYGINALTREGGQNPLDARLRARLLPTRDDLKSSTRPLPDRLSVKFLAQKGNFIARTSGPRWPARRRIFYPEYHRPSIAAVSDWRAWFTVTSVSEVPLVTTSNDK